VKNDAVAARIPESFSFADPIEPRDYPTDGQRAQLQAITRMLLDSNAPGTDDMETLMPCAWSMRSIAHRRKAGLSRSVTRQA